MKQRNVTFLTILFCLLAIDLSAQAPRLMNYQGVARHSDGTTITDQEIDLRISLISADDLDRPVYTEIHSITTNAFGLFSLKIGSGDEVYGSMDAIQWASAEHFIATEMDVDQVGQFTLMGTSQLVSVPYAFYAEKSGIAETTVDGTGRAIDFPGSNGQTIRHNGTDWEASSGLYHATSGNVGIGTTTPSSELDVDGDINIAQDRVLKIAGNQVISTKGQRNMFIGDGTGNFVTTGQDNTAIGFKAAEQLSEGTFNTIIGFKAAQNMSTALSNTIIGREAGKNSTGNQNVLIGREAGKNAEGSENTVIGDKAGLGITTGSSNTLIGKNANVGSGTLTNATAIGAGANANASNSVILGNNANVGIGTSSPQYKLEVTGDARVSGSIYDSSGDQGTTGQILSSTGSGTDWITGSGAGTTGPTGPAGANGSDGAVGVTGPTGSQGNQGVPGVAGVTGPTGVQGIAGPTGANGSDGADGITGPTGPAGSQGVAGPTGAQGVQGSIGATGPMGAVGPTGPAGSGSTDQLADTDNDTKIQVEKTLDEDIIRFDVSGSEQWAMKESRLEPANSGQSVFIGVDAGSNDDLSGNENVFIGHQTGTLNSTGTSNTYIGAGADGATALVNATAIGANTFALADSTVVLGDAAKVGIGTANPLHDLHVNGDVFATGKIYDSSGGAGTSGKVLSSTGSGTQWIPSSYLVSASNSVWGLYGNTLLPDSAFLGTLDGRDIPFRTNDTEVMRITNGGGLLINSSVAGTVTSPGAGRKLIWDATKMAFRVGSVSGSQWDSSNRGPGSVAMGIDPIASGNNSIAIGHSNMATGANTTAIGSASSANANFGLAIGYIDTASGLNSTAIGQLNTATAYLSSAVGSSNEASGVESSAFGHNSTASDSSSTAIGHRASATGKDAKAFGMNAAATGERSTAIGADVLASGDRSLAIGNHVKATAEGSIIIGNGLVQGGAPSAIETANDSANTFKLTMANYLNALPEIVALHDNSALYNYRAKVGIGKVPTTNLDVSGTMKADFIVLPELSLGNSSAIIMNQGNGVMKWQNTATAPFWNTIGGNYFYGGTTPHYIGTTLGEHGDLGFKINNEEIARFTLGGTFLTSGDNSGTVPTGIASGPHMLWSPQKRAFRTVDSDSIYLDPANIGYGSFAHGFNARASGDNGVAMGYNSSASGNFSLALNGSASGNNSVGISGSASGTNSIAVGGSASNGNSAFGNGTVATNGFAIGKDVTATTCHAIGNDFTTNAPNLEYLQIGVHQPVITVDRWARVGIFDSTPEAPLSVKAYLGTIGDHVAKFTGLNNASISLINTDPNGGSSWINLSDTIGHTYAVRANGADGYLQFTTPNNAMLYIFEDGSLSSVLKHGNSFPQAGFSSSIVGESRNFYQEYRTNETWLGTDFGPLVISTDVYSDKPDLFLDGTNVGIGTATPGRKLSVNGSVQVGAPETYFTTGDNKINFGDADYVYVGEVGSDDKLEMKGAKVFVNASTNLELKGTEVYANTSKFGVNTSTPLTKLHVSSGNWDVASGNGDMMIGNGTYNLKFGVADGGGGAGIGRINMTGGLGQLKLGGLGADAMTITNTSVGIGTSPSYRLHLSANSAAKPSSSSWTVASDARLKTDVREFSDGLDLIKKINPVWFTYNGTADMPNETAVGTIAQELQKEAPYMVSTWTHKDEKGAETEYLGVDYGAMDFVLINAIKELTERIEALEEENKRLRNK